MDTYSVLRQFADSWVLLAMFAFFIGAGIWAFLPSQSKAREDASMIPLRNDLDFDNSSEPSDSTVNSGEKKDG